MVSLSYRNPVAVNSASPKKPLTKIEIANVQLDFFAVVSLWAKCRISLATMSNMIGLFSPDDVLGTQMIVI